MGLNRDKFRKIVGGITTTEADTPIAEPLPSSAAPTRPEAEQPPTGQGRAAKIEVDGEASASDSRRFAKRGRPKGRRDDEAAGKTRKVKVSLFLSEALVNDLYNWAHEDRIHPGEMFELALKPFHERETKRRNAGKE
jgi:hypothetical protein